MHYCLTKTVVAVILAALIVVLLSGLGLVRTAVAY